LLKKLYLFIKFKKTDNKIFDSRKNLIIFEAIIN